MIYLSWLKYCISIKLMMLKAGQTTYLAQNQNWSHHCGHQRKPWRCHLHQNLKRIKQRNQSEFKHQCSVHNTATEERNWQSNSNLTSPHITPMQSSMAAWACFPKRKNNSTPSDQRWTEENWITSSTKAAIVIQVVSIVIADLLLWIREYSEGLAHFLELLFLLLLHLCSSRAVAICPIMPAKKKLDETTKIIQLFFPQIIFALRKTDLGGASELFCDRPFWSHPPWHSWQHRALCSNLSSCSSSTPAVLSSTNACALDCHTIKWKNK